jgi:hypothetical protein
MFNINDNILIKDDYNRKILTVDNFNKVNASSQKIDSVVKEGRMIKIRDDLKINESDISDKALGISKQFIPKKKLQKY